MATTKNTRTSKKKLTKAKAKAKARPLTWKFYVVTIGIFLVSVTAVIVIGLFASSYIAHQEAKSRLARIDEVYSTIKLNDSYQLDTVNVFGDKRVYDWDDSRTYSSEMQYMRGATVSETVSDLDATIKAAGFSLIDEPYPGAAFTEYHYKTQKGEYVRITVSSKPYDDAIKSAYLMDKASIENIYEKFDKNAGPSNVSIKVNLDDNNE